MTLKLIKPLSLAALLMMQLSFAQTFAQSHESKSYEQISLSSEVTKTIANDELNATLSKTAQATGAKSLSETLNNTLNQAMTIAKKYPSVKVSTGQQTAYPRHNKDGKIIGLTGSVSINLESKNFEQAGELMSELQTLMTVDSLDFKVSESSKQQHQKELMTAAITRFKQDAKDAATAFGAKDYKLVNANLDHQSHVYPVLRSSAMEAMDAVAASAAPKMQMSAGDSTLRYQVSGTIELVR